MNELAAVELLLVSEQQKANFPGQTRGRLLNNDKLQTIASKGSV